MQHPQTTISDRKKKFIDKMSSRFQFMLYTMRYVPLGFIAGMRIQSLQEDRCETSLPFKFLNLNPFKSIYFAAQSMAAELSTAALAMLALQDKSRSVAFIIVSLDASFPKKATGNLTFCCEDGQRFELAVQEAIRTGEAQTITARTTGRMQDGTIASEFSFTWSFKARSSN